MVLDWRYRHALLDPRPGAANPVLDDPYVLGVEVTVPALAGRCALGNLDPQHGEAPSRQAAIELALEVPLPPPGAVLVTIRPDPDSLGAMAVLGLRASGRVTAAAGERVAEIAAADGVPSSPWSGPRPTAPAASAAGASLRGIGAIAADAGLDLDERVRRVSAWLQTGSCDGLRAAAAKAERDWERAVAGARVGAASGSRVAVVCSTERLAIEVGYCAAPVVVAENPCFRLAGGPPHRKVTIAQYGPGWVDLGGVVGYLAAREPGWGGTATICGSPQGTSTEIPLEEIVATVVHRLLTGDACG